MYKATLHSMALFGASFMAAGAALAEMPRGPVTMIVGFSQGGGGDTLARELSRRISASTGTTIIVENIGGGAGSVAADALSRRTNDGTAIAMTLSMAHSFVPVATDVDYNINSFTYLASISATGTILAGRADRGYEDVEGLFEKAAADGSMIFGSLTPLDRLIIQRVARIKGFELDVIPGRGGSELRAALIAGDVDAISTGASGYRDIKDHDSLQPLATLNSQRLEIAPDLPTLRELGYEMSIDDNFVLFAPQGLDRAVSGSITSAILEAAADPGFQELVRRLGGEPIALEGDETRDVLERQTVDYRKLVDGSN